MARATPSHHPLSWDFQLETKHFGMYPIYGNPNMDPHGRYLQFRFLKWPLHAMQTAGDPMSPSSSPIRNGPAAFWQ